MLEPVILDDLLEAAATPLHVDQAREDISKDGIPAFGRYPHDIPVLHVYAVIHSPGRKDFKPVVKHIDVDFAADDQIITVNQRIHDTLCDRTLGIIRQFNTAIRFLEPAFMRVSLYESFSLLKKTYLLSQKVLSMPNKKENRPGLIDPLAYYLRNT